MAEVIWTLEAETDLNAIAEYISRDSEYFAWVVVEKTLQLANTIADQPLAGRIVPEFNNSSIRERFIYSYRLIYQITESTIEIITIIHGKQLLIPSEDDE